MFTFYYTVNDALNSHNQNMIQNCINDSKQWLNETESYKQWLYLYCIYPLFEYIVHGSLEIYILNLLFSIDDSKLKKLWESDKYQYLARNRLFGDCKQNDLFRSCTAAQKLFLRNNVCVYFILVLKLHFRINILFFFTKLRKRK